MHMPDRAAAVARRQLPESAVKRRKAPLLASALFRSSLCFAAAAAGLWLPQIRGQTTEGPRRPHFTDLAPRSGIPYVTNNNYTGRKYFQQPMCGGIAVLDYDNDGRMDIFFTNGARYPELMKDDASFYNCLLHNQGEGTFKDVTQEAGLTGVHMGFCHGAAAGDYDNDGFTDLFIAASPANTLYHNERNGTFVDVTERSALGKCPQDTL